jgi:hypothetical protein
MLFVNVTQLRQRDDDYGGDDDNIITITLAHEVWELKHQKTQEVRRP